MLDFIRNPKAGPWIVAGGIAFLVIYLLSIGVIYSHVFQSVYHRHAASEENAAREDNFEEQCSAIAEIVELRRCFEGQIESTGKTQRAQEDLYAQKQMAEWAFWMVIVSLAVGIPSVLMTGVGVILVYLNLREAREVTRAAMDTLRGERAWMLYSHTDVQGQGDPADIEKRIGFRFRVTFNNQGRSPARKVLVTSRRHFVTIGMLPGRLQQKPTPLEMHPPDITIGSKGTSAGNGQIFSLAEIQAVIAQNMAILVTARIDYEDVYGAEHASETCIMINVITDMATLMRKKLDSRRCFEFNIISPANYAT